MNDHNFPKGDKCVWKTTITCCGDFFTAKLFQQITVPICETHLNEHRIFMTLLNELSKKVDSELIKHYLLILPTQVRSEIVKQFELVPWDKI
jgi:hypothetical protein